MNEDSCKIQSSNYYHVEGWMVTDLELKGNELAIFAIIYGFSQKKNSWYDGSYRYLADWISGTKQTVINTLKSLVAKGYIDKVENVENGIKFVKYKASFIPPDGYNSPVKNFDHRSNQPVKNFDHRSNLHQEIDENFDHPGQNILPTHIHKNKYNKNKREGFIKPTIEEVAEYCREYNYKIDAEQFWHFYESKGWCVGNHPMKSWKSCVVTWVKREEKNKNHQLSSYDQPVPEEFEELFR